VRPCRAEESATPPYLIIMSLLSFKFDCLGPHIKQLRGFYQFAMKSRILVCVCGADGEKPRYYRVFTGTIARFGTFRTFRPYLTLSAILATLKFSRTNPRRPYDRSRAPPSSLCAWPYALPRAPPRAPSRAPPPRENRPNRPNLGSDFRWCWWFIPYSLPECFGRSWISKK